MELPTSPGLGRRRLPAAPLEDPLGYPGERPMASFRLANGVVEPIENGRDGLDAALDQRRTAVLAIGSNASPAQLTAKFRGHGCSDDLVGLVVTVGALQVRPSAHLSRHGYWPFAPANLDGTASEVVACLLTEQQVEVLDRTEPNYQRRRLDPAEHPVSLDGTCLGADAGPMWAYVSEHGIVDDPRLPAWTTPPPSQRALLTALLACSRGRWPPARRLPDPDALLAAVRERPALAEEFTAAMHRELRVRPSGLRTA